MIAAMRPHFDKIYSIELSDYLYESARNRFKDVVNVEILHGDSGTLLAGLMGKLQQPALFWLDAHYSMGETVRPGP
jgi:hypothetical protein